MQIADKEIRPEQVMETQASGTCQRFTTDLLLQEINPQRVVYRPGQRIFSCHEWADSVFFISHGSVEISMSGITVAVLFSEDFFGEHCLGQNEYRENSATALEETALVRIKKEDMLTAFRSMPKLREVFLANLVHQQQGLSFLYGLELSRGFDVDSEGE